MAEQFKGTVDSKSTIGFFVKIYLYFSNRNVVLETKVPTCQLVPRQELAVFKEGEQISIIAPECGECPAAVNNGATGNKICHVYRPNLPFIKK